MQLGTHKEERDWLTTKEALKNYLEGRERMR
jgi:hypothetical protein